MESKKPKYVSKFDYYVDDNGNFVKEARNSTDSSDNMVIIKPKYLNIDDELDNLTNLIKSSEVGLRQLRSIMVNNDDPLVKQDFDKLKGEYDKFILSNTWYVGSSSINLPIGAKAPVVKVAKPWE